jgi:hypothetical protein
MKWIFYSLLLANLAYMAVHLWGERVGMMKMSANTSNSAFENLDSRNSGFEEKNARIQLLSEARRFGNKSAVGGLLEQPMLVAPADGHKSCVGLGPFENAIAAQGIAERLAAAGYSVEMTAVDTRTGKSDYRVVMPPLGSRQEAFRRLRELRSRGIDSFVITRGVDAQGISLGVFSSNGEAEDYRQMLIGFGYDVLLNVLPRVNRGYWVQISQGIFPEEPLLDVAAEFIDVDLTEIACMN